jgi:hypothetical protein
MPLPLYWKPVGENGSRVLDNAYLVLEVTDSELAKQIRRKVGEGCIVPAKSSATLPLRLLARTDDRGVLMTLGKNSPLASDPLSLPALSPLLCPLGMSMRLWWTADAQTFEDVQRDLRDAASAPSVPMSSVKLVFDERDELPRAVEEVLLEMENGGELRPTLFRRREEVFPEEILRSTEDGRTWSIELNDHSLELAVNCALGMRDLAELGIEHDLPAHQLLLGHVLDILQRRGNQGDPVLNVVPMHQQIGGLGYWSLREDLASVVRRCSEGVKTAGPTLLAVYEAAFYELSLHPYPDGNFEHASGIVSRKWATKVLMDSAGLALRGELAQTLYNQSDEGLEERLLSIASGTGNPAQADAAEQFMARTTAVIAWLSKASSYVRDSVSLAGATVDPKTVEAITGWLEPIVVTAAQKKKAGRRAIVGAVTRAMRLAQAWAGLDPNFEFELGNKNVPLQGAPDARRSLLLLADTARWAKRFERAGRLLNLLNVLSLWDGMLKPQGEKPPVLKQMTDLHGLVDGLEGTYRILTDTAETELGIVLNGLAKPIAAVGIYMGLEDAWAKLQAGDGLGARLAASSVMIGILTLTLELASDAPHPAIKAVLLLAGLGLAAAAEYAMDEEEKFLESYRPGCENTGAYGAARNSVRAMASALERLEWEAERESNKAKRLM